MSLLLRTIIYASIFISVVLILVPASFLSEFGFSVPEKMGAIEILGIVIACMGALFALWCVIIFPLKGKGTPAPFDPPKKLIVNGPYRFFRNPMYIGAGIALIGAAIFYRSSAILAYMFLLWLITHLFIVYYEEPVLMKKFGEDYRDYCQKVNRWWPSFLS